MRAELLQVVNQRCDDMIRMYQNRERYNRSEIRRRECRLWSTSLSMLKGKRPVSVTFASSETIETPTWKKAVQTILNHCNGQPDMRKTDAAERKGVRQVADDTGEGSGRHGCTDPDR